MGLPFAPMPGPLDRGWTSIVCAASGPSFSAEQAEVIERARVAGSCRVIAVNTTGLRRLPRADVLFASDDCWWLGYGDELRATWRGGELWTVAFPVRANQTRQPRPADAFGARGVTLERGIGLCKSLDRINNGGNSGYSAIGLAYLFGARRIALIGYDLQRTGGKTHHFGDHGTYCRPNGEVREFHNSPAATYVNWVPRFIPLAKDLQAAGVDVVNCTSETALTCFRRADLKDTLDSFALQRDER